MTPDVLTRRRAEVAGKLARAEMREAQTRAEESTNRGLTCDNGDASDPRDAPTSGGLAGNLSGGPDMGSIAPNAPLRAPGGAA